MREGIFLFQDFKTSHLFFVEKSILIRCFSYYKDLHASMVINFFIVFK